MPEGSVLPCAPRTPTLRALIVLKKNWAVSVEAVAYRLHALKFVSDWNYRRLCIEMAQAGYHRKEPEGIARETSQVLMKVFAGLRAEGMKRTRIARELCLQVEELDSLVFGLLPLSPIQGGVSESPVKTAQGRAHLRIV
jgi:hypothetical protein